MIEASECLMAESMMADASLPPFVADWPEARMEVAGLSGRILKGTHGWVIYMSADRRVEVPSHRHGAQWGVVLDGEMELTIGDETRTYRRGQAHYIPAGVEHRALLSPGWKGFYVFSHPLVATGLCGVG